LIAKREAIEPWQTFLNGIVTEIVQTTPRANRERSEEKCRKGIILRWMGDPSLSKYALTLCGDRLVVVNYVGASMSQDNPTFDVRNESPVRQLYEEDLRRILARTDESVRDV
jgi:hypothetical protein